jgi:hypothetical protein
MDTAHLRVGAAATASFLVLLLLFAVHGSATPSPAAAPAVTPAGQQEQLVPGSPDPGFRRDRRRGGNDGFRGGGRGGPPGGSTPAPDTGGNTT